MKKATLLSMLLISVNLVFAQYSGWENYVNPDLITDYVETNNELWFSSKNGVIELDKSTLQITEHNRSNSNILSNSVEGIAVDGNGSIWIGTYEQAIGKFDGTSWQAIPYPANLFNTPNAIETYCIEVDNQDVVWVGTSEGLVRYDGTNWQLYDTQSGLQSLHDVWAMEVDNQGNLFIASFSVYKYDGNSFQEITDPNIFPLYGEASLKKQSNGDLWLAGFSGLLGKYDGTSWIKYDANNGDIPQKQILDLNENANGEMCVTFYDEGRFVFQNGVWNQSIDVANSNIDSTYLSTYFYDNQGNEWIGSKDKLLKNSQNPTLLNLKSHTVNDNRFIRDISVDANGKIYVVNRAEIATFDGSNWSNFTLPVELQNSNFPIINRVLFTTNGSVFINSTMGIHYWNGTNWTFFTEQNSALPTDNMNEWRFDENTQTLWIGTYLGLVKFDGTNFTTYDPSNTPLTDDYIWAFNFDINGLLYVAVNHEDIFTFDGMTWQSFVTTAPPTNVSFTEIHFDKDNTLWLGSRGDGIFKLENTIWQTINMSNSNLPEDKIYQILSNANGKLFIATDGGLATIDNGIVEAFTIQNSGIGHNKVLNMTFDYSDNLWLGTSHGVSVLALNATNTKPIIIQNNSLKVFPNPIRTSATVTFDLNHATNNIRVKITSLDGKTIQEQLIEGKKGYGTQQLEINRNQITNGLYYLLIQTDTEQLVQPILMQD